LLSNNMDASILKENHYYFGNFRPKSGDEKEKKPKEDYFVHTFPTFIIEKGYTQECVKILITLMRQGWALINPSTLWNNMVPQFVPYGTIVRENCSKEVVVEPAKGKRKAVTAKKVPQKVRSNALLLPAELSIINRYVEPLFKPTPYENLSQDQWVQSVWANGLSSIKRDLSAQYNLRATFLSRLASLTTKRLRALRATSDANKTKRKADVTVSDLSSLLLGRVNPVQEFAQEILLLDPTGELFLKEYFLGLTLDWSKIGGGSNLMNHIKEKISTDIDELGIYSDLLSSQQEKREQISQFLAAYKAKEDARTAFFTELQNKYGANLVNKWATNVLTYDFPTAMADKGKVKAKGKAANRNPVVPHESKKPQGVAKKAAAQGKKHYKFNPRKGEFEGYSIELEALMRQLLSETKEFETKPRMKLYLRLETLMGTKKPLPPEFKQYTDYMSQPGHDRNTLWLSLLAEFANLRIVDTDA
jgi:hypothetical protein